MKKIHLFFAIMMMAVTSSYAKVYEIDCTQNKRVHIMAGESVTINGVVITSLNGDLDYQDRDGGYWDWWGYAKENSFQISTEKGETITHIEITGEATLLDGTEWTKTATGVTWTGSALSVNFGSGFESTKLKVTVDSEVATTLNTAGYATFSCNKNVRIIDAEAYKASVNGETITLTKLTGYIPAGTGVILYSKTPSTTVTMSVATSSDAAADVSANALRATTKADGSVVATVDANSWALSSNNTFRKYEGTSYRANRAYLVHEVSSSAATRALSIANGETGTTGLDNIDSQASAREGNVFENGKIVIIRNGKKYNLAGQEIK